MYCMYPYLSRESGEKKTKCGQIAPRTHSDGPVSQTCLLRLLRRELLRAVTLDDSTPQRRISELRVWSYEPFIVFAPSSSGYTCGQNLKVLYRLIIRNNQNTSRNYALPIKKLKQQLNNVFEKKIQQRADSHLGKIMRADFTLWKNNDALNCTQKNNDALNCTLKK